MVKYKLQQQAANHALLHRIFMALAAKPHGERHRHMTDSAGFALHYLCHCISYRSFLGTLVYQRMANLTPIPDNMFLVGKYDIGPPQ